jgi:hypothetical protein
MDASGHLGVSRGNRQRAVSRTARRITDATHEASTAESIGDPDVGIMLNPSVFPSNGNGVVDPVEGKLR